MKKITIFSVIAAFSLTPGIQAMQRSSKARSRESSQETAPKEPSQSDLNTQLWRAIYLEGDKTKTKQLIAAGADVNYLLYATTVLMAAAKKGLLDCMHLLIEGGAQVNFACQYASDQTALHCAARQGQHEAIHLLIENKATVDPIFNDWLGDGKQTPLMLAARQGHPDCVRELIAGGANVNYIDQNYRTNGNTALFVATDNCVSLLLDAGANFEHADAQGNTAFTFASRNGNTERCELLIERMLNNPKEKMGKFLAACKKANYCYQYSNLRNIFERLFPIIKQDNRNRVLALVKAIHDDHPNRMALKAHLLKKYFNQ